MKQNLSKKPYEQGDFSFFLFNFVISKVWEKFPKNLQKLVELTLNKQNIMNYFVKNETKKFKKKIVNDVIYIKKRERENNCQENNWE